MFDPDLDRDLADPLRREFMINALPNRNPSELMFESLLDTLLKHYPKLFANYVNALGARMAHLQGVRNPPPLIQFQDENRSTGLPQDNTVWHEVPPNFKVT